MTITFKVYADDAEEVREKSEEVLNQFFVGKWYRVIEVTVNPTMMNAGTGKPVSWQADVTATDEVLD